jgi:hypothetical protein
MSGDRQFAPPRRVSPSPLLGHDTCRTRFGAAVVDLKVTRRLPVRLSFAPSRVVDFFDYYGPTTVYASPPIRRGSRTRR